MALRRALDAADAAFAQARSTAQAELETGFGRVVSQGHGPLAATVDELEERAASQQWRNEHAWSDLAAGQPSRRGLTKEESALLAFLRACSGRSLTSLLEESLGRRRPKATRPQ